MPGKVLVISVLMNKKKKNFRTRRGCGYTKVAIELSKEERMNKLALKPEVIIFSISLDGPRQVE